jgi:hypothetical protein
VLSGSTGIIRPQLVNFPPVSVSGDPSRGSSACRILPKSQGDMVDMAHVRTFRWQRNNYWPLNVLIDKKCVGRHGDSMATWRWCRKIRRPTTRTNHSGIEFQTSAVEEPPRRNNSGVISINYRYRVVSTSQQKIIFTCYLAFCRTPSCVDVVTKYNVHTFVSMYLHLHSLKYLNQQPHSQNPHTTTQDCLSPSRPKGH